MMRHSYCASVFENLTVTENEELDVVASELHKFNCENLAAKQKSQDCLSIGLPAVLNTSQTCYESNGIGAESTFAYQVVTVEILRLSWQCKQELREMGRRSQFSRQGRVQDLRAVKFS